MADLSREVKDFAIKQGAHLVGIAPVERFEGAPQGHHPTDLLPEAKSVISIAMRFFQSTLRSHTFGLESELIPPEGLRRLQNEVYSFMYDTDNRGLEWMAVQIAHLLIERGYQALPLPASGSVARYRDETGRMRWRGFFSHRHAAVLAGLGDIGVNNLLITSQYGPRVRVNSVITNAELTPDPLLEEPVCRGEECLACVRSRPCWGELWELKMAGKVFKVATFMGCSHVFKPGDGPEVCRRGGEQGHLPFIRSCIGSCPVGINTG